MFYRASDTTASMDDWIELNSSQLPTEALAELYNPDTENFSDGRMLARLDSVCTHCGGSGEVELTELDADGDEWTFSDDCPECGGSGEAADSELHAWPAAHGTCRLVDDRDEVREAAIRAGFVVYECDGGPFHGCLALCIDGGGYSFRGQHWLPLRAALAAEQIKDDAELATFFWAWVDETAQREGESLASVKRRAGLEG